MALVRTESQKTCADFCLCPPMFVDGDFAYSARADSLRTARMKSYCRLNRLLLPLFTSILLLAGCAGSGGRTWFGIEDKSALPGHEAF